MLLVNEPNFAELEPPCATVVVATSAPVAPEIIVQPVTPFSKSPLVIRFCTTLNPLNAALPLTTSDAFEARATPLTSSLYAVPDVCAEVVSVTALPASVALEIVRCGAAQELS